MEELTFIDDSNIPGKVIPNSPTSESESSDDTQTLIDEMEVFLTKHERSKVIEPQQTTDMKEEIIAETTGINQDKQAEEILEALMNGTINMDDSGYGSSINNISEITTDDGKQVIIVVTNDMQDQQTDNNCMMDVQSSIGSPVSSLHSPCPSTSNLTEAASPHSTASYVDDSSDSDWSPHDPPKTAQQLKKSTTNGGVSKKRGPYKRSSTYNIKDKKERKKMQNVVAARRYRDKKKSEQFNAEEEEQMLSEKNKELKTKLRDMEGEVRTLKKLMLELGLVKVKKWKVWMVWKIKYSDEWMMIYVAVLIFSWLTFQAEVLLYLPLCIMVKLIDMLPNLDNFIVDPWPFHSNLSKD